MKHTRTSIVALITVLGAGFSSLAMAQDLLPAESFDLTAETLVVTPRLKTTEAPREMVKFTRQLDQNTPLKARTEPFLSRSQEYFVDVTAEDLRQGVPLYTTAPGALVRLNPAVVDDESAAFEKAAILPSSLVLIDSAGKAYSAGSGMDLMVGPEQLKAAGAPFTEGTSAFRIREELGVGTFELRADGLTAKGSRRYVVHVFDRQSAIELRLRTGATDYLHGQTLTVEAKLDSKSGKVRTGKVDGFITSPAGRAWPLEFQHAGAGLYRASLVLDAIETPAPGLWEVHASARGLASGSAVLRAVRTAFSCTAPGARFAGAAEVAATDDQLTIQLAIEAASASRYEARAVLYATASDGSLRPAAIAHSASWLEPGVGALELAFDAQDLADRDLAAPFEVRDLRLTDQLTMGLLHRQERALAIDR